MITRLEEPYEISRKEIDQKFDGCWVLLVYKDLKPEEGNGYLFAYGSFVEDEQKKDIDDLFQIAKEERLGGSQVIRGYKNRGKEMLHVL